MKVLLNLDDPIVMQNELNRQRKLRDKIKIRWANKTNKKTVQGEKNLSDVFGFHF